MNKEEKLTNGYTYALDTYTYSNTYTCEYIFSFTRVINEPTANNNHCIPPTLIPVSLSNQLGYCHGINKKCSAPSRLYFTGVGPKILNQLSKVCKFLIFFLLIVYARHIYSISSYCLKHIKTGVACLCTLKNFVQ